MVVGIHEAHDYKLKRKAHLFIREPSGYVRRSEEIVYGDRRDPARRDVFPARTSAKLPRTAKVWFLANEYVAELSFRTGRLGARVPVYTWRIK